MPSLQELIDQLETILDNDNIEATHALINNNEEHAVSLLMSIMSQALEQQKIDLFKTLPFHLLLNLPQGSKKTEVRLFTMGLMEQLLSLKLFDVIEWLSTKGIFSNEDFENLERFIKPDSKPDSDTQFICTAALRRQWDVGSTSIIDIVLSEKSVAVKLSFDFFQYLMGNFIKNTAWIIGSYYIETTTLLSEQELNNILYVCYQDSNLELLTEPLKKLEAGVVPDAVELFPKNQTNLGSILIKFNLFTPQPIPVTQVRDHMPVTEFAQVLDNQLGM